MYTLTAKRDGQTFRFYNRDLLTLQGQTGEYDSAKIVDISGSIVYALAPPNIFKLRRIKMTTYNHAYTIAFCLESNIEDGAVSGAELRTAILKTLSELSDDELEENAGFPFDSYEVESK